MKKSKLMIVLVGLMLVMMSSCGDQTQKLSNRKMAENQESIMQEANRQTGMPAIVNYQERKLMKQIFELRDQANLVCYAYVIPEMTGKPVFLGKCMGYGLPYSTQFTNPMTLETPGISERGCTTMPQADPNGLFMPESADGTWLMLINPKTGQPQPVYIESRVMVSPFPLD